MLTDTNKKHLSPKKRAVDADKCRWSDSQKMEAVKYWLVVGDMKKVAVDLNIPYDTVKSWKYSKWWGAGVNDLRTESTIQLSGNLKKLAEMALETTIDRLENGDYFYDQKTGQMVRKPVPMREANKVAHAMLDLHIKLDKKPQEEADNKAVKDRLDELKEQFAQFANNFKRPKLDVVDVTFTEKADHALHAEREEGLQEGSGVGEEEETFETDGQGEEDSSPQGS